MMEKKEKEEKVRFEMPILGSFAVSINEFKHLTPFTHYNAKEKKEYLKERSRMKEFTVWHNGCGINGVNKVEEGYPVIKEYAETYLKSREAKLKEELKNVQKMIEQSKEFDWIHLYRVETKE